MKLPVQALDVRAALKEAMSRLREARVPSHALAAELLLMHVLERDRAWLYAHPEAPVDAAALARYGELVTRRIAGTPTQYLTGRQEFWGLEFEVTPDVLIPRPETEHLVEVALARLEQHRAQEKLRVADAGTGSGCLAVALARELPEAEVFATDISAAALGVARRNAARHGVADRVGFVQCNLLDALSHESQVTSHRSLLHLIVSNPPYISHSEKESLPREVREHEPQQAFLGGQQGVEIYAPLVRQARSLLVPGGIVVLELGYNTLDNVLPLLSTDPDWWNVMVTNDLAGIPRVLSAERL